MRSKPALTYGVLFFLSGATGLIYELLWVRVLYQSFGSTIQSVTTVVAAYMGGLGLGAWLFGRRADRTPRPAVLYGWLEIAIGLFAILSPLVLGLAHWMYIGTAGALALGGAASVALRFGLAALVLLIPTTLMGGTLPVLTRALTGEDRGLLKPSLGRLYGLNTLGAMTGTALAGFFLIELVGVRASLLATATVNLAIGVAAISLGRREGVADPGREPAEDQVQPAPAARDHLKTVALVLLGVTAFAALLDEIAWTRVLIMIVGGSTYAFTLILLVFLLGIGLGSIIVARRSAPPVDTAASAALAQGITGIGEVDSAPEAVAALHAGGVQPHDRQASLPAVLGADHHRQLLVRRADVGLDASEKVAKGLLRLLFRRGQGQVSRTGSAKVLEGHRLAEIHVVIAGHDENPPGPHQPRDVLDENHGGFETVRLAGKREVAGKHERVEEPGKQLVLLQLLFELQGVAPSDFRRLPTDEMTPAEVRIGYVKNAVSACHVHS